MFEKYSHFLISLILPPMVFVYYRREKTPVVNNLHNKQDERGKPRFEGKELKRRMWKRLWNKPDFYYAVYGSCLGILLYLALAYLLL